MPAPAPSRVRGYLNAEWRPKNESNNGVHDVRPLGGWAHDPEMERLRRHEGSLTGGQSGRLPSALPSTLTSDSSPAATGSAPTHRHFRFRRGPEVGGQRRRAEEVEEVPGGRFPPPSASRFRVEWSGGRTRSGAG